MQKQADTIKFQPADESCEEKSNIPAIIAAISVITATGIGLGLSYPLCSLLMESRGHSTTIIGANTAMAAFSGLVIIPYCSAIARKAGLVNALVGASIIATLSFLAMSVFHSLIAWFVLRFTMHGALTVLFILGEFWITASTPDKNRGLVFGIYATILSTGFAIGPAILMVTGFEGFLPFVVGAVLIALATVPAILARAQQPVLERKGNSGSMFPFLFMVPAATLGVFVFGFTEMTASSLLPLHSLNMGFDEKTAALFLVLVGAGNVIFQIPLGLWGDRLVRQGYSRKPLLLLCAIVGTFGALLIPLLAGNSLLLQVNLFVWGGVIAGLYTLGLAHLGSRVKGNENLAQANAAFGFSYVVGAFIGPQLVGISMDFFPVYGFPAVLAMIFLLYSAFLIIRGGLNAGGNPARSEGSS